MTSSSHTRWTVGRRITTGFAVIVAIVAAIGGISFLRVSLIDRSTRSVVDNALPAIVLLGQIQSLVKENFINTTQHILTDDDARKRTIQSEMDAKSASLTELYGTFEKLLTTPEDQALYAEVKSARGPYRDTRNSVLEASLAHDDATARQLLDQKLYVVYRTYINALQAMVQHSQTLAVQKGATSTRTVRETQVTLIVGVAGALVAALAIAWLITRSTSGALRSITTELTQGSQQLANAAGAISSSSQSLAHGATTQAAAIQETSATLQEVASMTERNAQHAAHGKTLAGETRSAAETSAAEMQKMNAAMDAIKGASDNIAKIIKTIHEIAFQTNVLALNAAVEAARAGEAGMGFAIVAEEVRSLAQRSAAAAHETTERIEDSIRKSEHGVDLSRSVATSLDGILSRVREVDSIIGEIATASSTQSQHIGQILGTVTQMDHVTQTTAASAEESASASEELNAQAVSVDAIVARLERLVSDARKPSVPAESPAPRATATSLRPSAPRPNPRASAGRLARV